MSAIFGETLIFRQENGPDVELVVFGDEFYARYETKEGYSVVYDEALKLYCYLTLVGGQCASTCVPIHKPPPSGLCRHLTESVTTRQNKFGRKYAQLRPPEPEISSNVMRALGPDNGLLNGRKVPVGKIKGLTILVEFQDLSSTVSKEDVKDLLNKDNYHRYGNFSSVKEYFEIVSDKKLEYSNTVVGPVKLSQNQFFYRSHLLVKEALDLAVNDLGVDLSEFDSRGEGIVDAVNFMYAGRTFYDGDLWPHNSSINLNYGNVRTHFYMLTSLGRKPVDLSIGTFCHESGHLLCRFPDMYDYGNRDGDNLQSQGIGQYCLMGSGNHLNKGRTPSPVCSYLRELVGWASASSSLGNPGQYEAIHGDYGKVMKYSTNQANEYFIVENRTRRGLDSHLPSTGLAVYHCDLLGSNEWQGGTQDRHYQCALLQADGHLDLENNRNRGDEGDLFPKVNGDALSHTTVPSSRGWDGSDSGMTLSNITEPGIKIRFQMGDIDKKTISKKVVADLLIPDNKPEGIHSFVDVAERGKIKSIKVFVDIVHSWISDLQVELEVPSGDQIMLHDKEGEDGDDIDETYSSDSKESLQVLLGKPFTGNWTLHIKDMEPRDTGRLNEWGFEIEYEDEGEDRVIEIVAEPAMAIPDNNNQGVVSAIVVKEEGTVQEISVRLDISHSYIGDLMVELLAPSGHAALLHNKDGFGQDDLKGTYNNRTTPSLKGLVNQEIKGTWQLRVKDLEPVDTGEIKKWSLKIGFEPKPGRVAEGSSKSKRMEPQIEKQPSVQHQKN